LAEDDENLLGGAHAILHAGILSAILHVLGDGGGEGKTKTSTAEEAEELLLLCLRLAEMPFLIG
jgi:hypothetical protein